VKRGAEKDFRLTVRGDVGESGVDRDALRANAIRMNHIDRTIHELNCARHQGVGEVEREIQDEEKHEAATLHGTHYRLSLNDSVN